MNDEILERKRDMLSEAAEEACKKCSVRHTVTVTFTQGQFNMLKVLYQDGFDKARERFGKNMSKELDYKTMVEYAVYDAVNRSTRKRLKLYTSEK